MNNFGIRLLLLILFSAVVESCAAEKPAFNADSAWKYLLAQCAFGPRNPGSEGHRKCGDYLFRELSRFTSRVQEQPFTFTDKRLHKTFDLRNLIADFGPETSPKIILCAHWDTRPRSDMDPNSENREKPILGANDGASGVAVLLEMARLFADTPPSTPVQIIFFDGEDYGRSGENWDYLLGSKYFARNADPAEYKYALLLDLIGDEDLEPNRGKIVSTAIKQVLQEKIQYRFEA